MNIVQWLRCSDEEHIVFAYCAVVRSMLCTGITPGKVAVCKTYHRAVYKFVNPS